MELSTELLKAKSSRAFLRWLEFARPCTE